MNWDEWFRNMARIVEEAKKLPPLPEAVKMSPRDFDRVCELVPSDREQPGGFFGFRTPGHLELMADDRIMDGRKNWLFRVRGEWVHLNEEGGAR